MSIFKKMLIISAIIFTIVCTASQASFRHLITRIAQQEQSQELETFVLTQSIKLESSIMPDLALALQMVKMPSVLDYMKNPSSAEAEAKGRADFTAFSEALSSHSVFWISNADLKLYQGGVYSYTVDTSSANDAWYTSMRSSGEKYNFNVNYNSQLQSTNMWINVSIYEDNTFLGIAGTSIPLDVFLNNVYSNMGKDTDVWFFNKDTGLITGAKDTKLLDKSVNEALVGTDVLGISKTESESGASHFIHKNKAGAIVFIPSFNWNMVVLRDIQTSEIEGTLSVIMWLSSIAILLIVFVFTLSIKRVIKPIGAMSKNMKSIAEGNADLTKRIPVSSNDEIGKATTEFNTFTAKLQSIISEVKNSNENLANSGENMNSQSTETAAAIAQISTNIQNVHQQIKNQGNSVNQTASAVNEIAGNISSLEKMIETQSEGVSSASAAVEEMISNIASVNDSVDKMVISFESLRIDAQSGISKQKDVNTLIKNIENQSAMLQEANAVISSIAEQTNLLAMNAAIEAAHAGNTGKGFSVVADEIRKLSVTSTTQSKRIGDQLNGIKNSIATVVDASKQSVASFESVSQKIQDTDGLITQIKDAMQEQTQGSRQINEVLHTMNDSTLEVRNASKEMGEGNRAILTEISALQDTTANMKSSMEKMALDANGINERGLSLSALSKEVKNAIEKIGNQINQFKV